MRIIDVDALLEDLIFPTEQFKKGFTETLYDAPTIDLIHCSDCRFRYGSSCTRFAEIPVTPEDYCSRGKKK